ncbi:MAG: protein kinase [Acidobacteriota bacterium]
MFSTDQRYEIRAFLGSGGMGQVYRAWDRALSREVALKILRNTDPKAERRALREARLQSRVDHPAICRILDVGRQDDRPTIAMELIEGPTLSAIAETLPRDQRLRCLLPVVRGIDAAHRAGLVHRDLKPANILVRRADAVPEMVVVDFGLARALAEDGTRLATDDRLTVTGQVLGTPAYMSPEQIRGEEVLDARSDIYSLGCVLYELVAGRTPFRDTSEIEVLMSAIQHPAPPLRTVVDDVSPALERLIETCLEKRPEDRYPSAARLADDLERILDGEPITLEAPSLPARLRRWSRHHPRARRGLIAFSSCLLVVTAFVGTQWRHRAQSDREAQAAQRFGARAERLATTLGMARLAPAHSLTAAKADGRREIVALEHEARALGTWGLPAARYALGVASLELGELRAAQAHLEAASEAATPSDDALHRALIEVLVRRFVHQVETLSYLRRDLREVHFDRLRARYLGKIRRLVADRLPTDATGGYLDALRHIADQDWTQAIASCERTLAGATNHWRCHELIGQIHRVLGIRADLAGDDRQAVARLRLAIASFERATAIARSDERLFAKVCLAEAILLDFELRSGHVPRRAPPASCRTAVEIDTAMPEPYLAQALWWQRTATAEYRANGDPEEPLRRAGEQLGKALERAAADSSVIAHTLMAVQLLIEHDLTSWHAESHAEQLERAADHARAAISMDPGTLNARVTLGQILSRQATLAQRSGESPLPMFREAITLIEAVLADAPNLVQAWTQLGILHDDSSRVAAASGEDPEPHLRQARSAFGRAIELDPGNPTVLVNLGITYLFEAGRRFHRGAPTASEVDAGDQVFLDAIERTPDRLLLHYTRAELLTLRVRSALERGEDGTDAMAELRQAHALPFTRDAIEYGCSQGKVEWLQAWSYRQLKQRPEAALRRGFAAIDTVLGQHPQSWRCLRDRGRLGLEAYRWRRARGAPDAAQALAAARRDLESALQLNPHHAELHRWKARLDLASAEAAAVVGERRRLASSSRDALDTAEALQPGYRYLARDRDRARRLAESSGS